MRRILLLPHIKIHNANALSSPFTIGFPAMTAWLGGVHALQRALNTDEYETMKFISVAVVCHEFNLQTFMGNGDYVHSIVGTGNPLDKTGKRSAFIEEARCHLTVSLVIEYEGIELLEKEEFLEAVTDLLYGKLKLAGGDILELRPPELLTISLDEDFYQLRRKLMPGYTLLERRDLMIKAMRDSENGEKGQDAIDALLDFLKITHKCEKNEVDDFEWVARRKARGWIVPIATGFHGLTELGSVANQRDPTVPHRFAESLVTLGEFVMPYRVQELNEMLWHYHVDSEKNLYLCQQNKQSN